MLDGVVVGAGDRGYDAYAPWLLDHPEVGRIVGVAEPNPDRRARFAQRFSLDPEGCVAGWDELFDRPRFADFALVTTGDRHHVEPTLRALDAGYHVLLEKPMALTEADCVRLVEAAERADRVLQICHVFRYSPFFNRLHQIVSSGELGTVVAIQLSENVAFWHYAHSYARGNTRRREVPWLLQKACHDLDLLHWLAGAPPVRVTSLVRPTELTEANAPPGAPDHCIDGCPHARTCPYDAVALYLDLEPLLHDLGLHRRPPGLSLAARVLERVRPALVEVELPPVQRLVRWDRWPVGPVSDDTSRAGLTEALRTTRWGRCAWKVGDNDQPSAQTVDIEFANGVLASFTLQSVSYRSMREIRVDGTAGTAHGHLYGLEADLEVVDHKSGRRRREPVPPAFDGHGGGDHRLFAAFLDSLATGAEPLTSAAESLTSHRIAFAALRAAEGGTVEPL